MLMLLHVYTSQLKYKCVLHDIVSMWQIYLTRIYFLPIPENEQEMLINGFVLADMQLTFVMELLKAFLRILVQSGLVIARSDHSVVCLTWGVSFPLWRRTDTIRMLRNFFAFILDGLLNTCQTTWHQHCT